MKVDGKKKTIVKHYINVNHGDDAPAYEIVDRDVPYTTLAAMKVLQTLAGTRTATKRDRRQHEHGTKHCRSKDEIALPLFSL